MRIRADIRCILLWVLLSSGAALADSSSIQAAWNAHGRGQVQKAIDITVAAVRDAEQLGEHDRKLVEALNALAALYQTEGRYREAVPSMSANWRCAKSKAGQTTATRPAPACCVR